MRQIELFEYMRLRDWTNCTNINLYKKYVKAKDGDKVEVNIILCFTDEEGIRQCYNTMYFEGYPILTSNFDMKALYVNIKDSSDANHYFNQIQFTERYEDFVIYEPIDEIPFDKEGTTAELLEFNVIDKKIFEEEEGFETLFIFKFNSYNGTDLLNTILLT